MKLKSRFSSIILKARTELGYTQSEVAEAISVTVRWYQKVESGARFPGSVTLVRLILFLNINVEELRDTAGLVVPVLSPRRRPAKKEPPLAGV